MMSAVWGCCAHNLPPRPRSRLGPARSCFRLLLHTHPDCVDLFTLALRPQHLPVNQAQEYEFRKWIEQCEKDQVALPTVADIDMILDQLKSAETCARCVQSACLLKRPWCCSLADGFRRTLRIFCRVL